MLWRNSATRYGVVAKTFHWAMALGILTLLAIGIGFDWMSQSQRFDWVVFHKALGITVLALAILRLLWTGLAGRPKPLPGARWQHVAAHAVHGLLYVLMVAVPLSGWALNSAEGFPLPWFGLFTVPTLFAADRALHEPLGTLHWALAYALLGLIVLHAAAALQHHILLRDDTLRRMIPFGRPRPTSPTPAAVVAQNTETLP